MKKREDEMKMLEQKRKLEKQINIRKLAKSSELLREFIKECEKSFSVPDIELMCRLKDSFGMKKQIILFQFILLLFL